MDGCEPSDATVEKFREFLTTYCKKPGGIEIVRSDVIPRPVAQGLPRYGLAHRYLNGPPVRAGEASPAFVYVLFYDGALCDETAASGAGGSGAPKREAERNVHPYREGLPYPAVILINDRYMPSVMNEDALVHEAGHLLGLVRRPESGSTLHCPDTACRMADCFRLHKVYLNRVRGAFGDDAGKHYQQPCKNCMAELEASSAAAPPTNVRFVGPVLIRSEAGYHVLSLPGRVRVIVGDLSEQDCRDFAAAARRDPPATNEAYSDGEIKPELVADEAKALEIIQRAKGIRTTSCEGRQRGLKKTNMRCSASRTRSRPVRQWCGA